MDAEFSLSTNNLYIRPGESFRLLPEPPAEGETKEYHRVYAVAFIPTPPFPHADVQPTHSNTRSLAVVCTEVYPTLSSNGESRIGWVNLGRDEKENIGRALEEIGAEVNRWFYLVLDTRKYQE